MLSVQSLNPQSAILNPQSRRALTLAEVLIAMGLMTLGLLGVAAVFPVGGFYMQSGDIADRGGAIAQAALEDASIRGYLDPKNWVLHDGSLGANSPSRFIHFLDGWREGALVWPGLRDALANLAASYAGATTPAAELAVFGERQRQLGTQERYTSKLLGGAFVIDPIGLAATLSSNTTPTINDFNNSVARVTTSTPVRGFPATLPDATDMNVWPDFFVNFMQWPVRRITPIHAAKDLNSSQTYWQQLSRAQQLFTAGDDLSLMLPDDNDAAAQGLWQVLDGVAGRPAATRQSNRDYSWLLTVAPKSSAGLNAMATKPDAYPVEVSAVVFHKRAVGRGYQSRLESERAVNADVIQSGTAGGELLLTRRASDTVSASPFEGLRVGQYLMVFGPHPLSNATRPMLALRWCRIVSIEKQGPLTVGTTTVELDGANRVLVSLRGPDWPWTGSGTPVASNLRVGILPGVVAVHTKTMRLESATEWAIR